MKTCTGCGDIKNECEYYANNKEHWRLRHRKYHAANKERMAKRAKAKRALPSSIEKAREYRKKHAARYKISISAWIKRNPEKMKARYLRAYAKDRTSWNVSGANRRARIKKAGGKFTTKQWIELKKLCGNKCVCCGVPESEKRMTIDHVVPIILGGSNDISNIQPLCAKCNRTKWNKHIDYREVA